MWDWDRNRSPDHAFYHLAEAKQGLLPDLKNLHNPEIQCHSCVAHSDASLLLFEEIEQVLQKSNRKLHNDRRFCLVFWVNLFPRKDVYTEDKFAFFKNNYSLLIQQS